ncbi:NAD(P)H-hydrate dehydratase [Methylocapsa acidiphila]|uniref:NAD(P)H-hydrate dehydratase n=1 Tax=Methylocapsa acidiphila TaxID=133552 RepID=UPI0004087C29|nr:NAD(P)H-hydrate dehydratase [Methylocapsa acidiphila]
MAEADRLTIAGGVPGFFLMEQAGAAVAREAERLAPRAARIAVLCGPGNNGGDGFVAARRLAAKGFPVEIGLLGRVEALSGDAAAAAKAWTGATLPIESLDLAEADLAIDALFGAGLSRDLDGGARAAVLRLNDWARAKGKAILAVDVPSGVDGATGAIRGVAIAATCTVTFFRRKPGHVLLPGRLQCGETIVADIGISESVLAEIRPKTLVNDPAIWKSAFPFPRTQGNKYSRGHALVLSGGLAHTGAARLAARGALRAGAGLVTVATPREALPAHAAALTAIMTRLCDGPAELAALLEDRRMNALVMGPALGVGEATRALAFTALQADAPATEPRRAIVLDADALTSFKNDALSLAAAIRKSGAPVVLTPHDGEFARLFSGLGEKDLDAWRMLGLDEIVLKKMFVALRSGSKLDRARAASALIGAVLLLKGPDTVVASPSGDASIAEDLPPWLATAGSGDVLAGFIGGLLAQGTPPFEAASAAVWLHGAAGRHFGPGLVAEDLPENLPPVLRALLAVLGQ